MRELRLQQTRVAKVKTQLITWRSRRLMRRLVRHASCAAKLAEICLDNNTQSAIFRSTVDHFEPSVEGGALGFRGL